MKLPAILLASMSWLVSGHAMAENTVAATALKGYLHRHGVARIQIAVEGDMMELRLQAPLHSLLGFETAPRTGKQRQAVRRMAAELHQPQGLFVPVTAAGCTPAAVVLVADGISPVLLSRYPGSPAAPTRGAAASPGGRRAGTLTGRKAHADLEAKIWFKCDRPQSLTGLQVRVFDAFAALHQIDVEIVTPKGRSGARLSPRRASVTW